MVAYHSGQFDKSRKALTSAQAKFFQVSWLPNIFWEMLTQKQGKEGKWSDQQIENRTVFPALLGCYGLPHSASGFVINHFEMFIAFSTSICILLMIFIQKVGQLLYSLKFYVCITSYRYWFSCIWIIINLLYGYCLSSPSNLTSSFFQILLFTIFICFFCLNSNLLLLISATGAWWSLITCYEHGL